MSVRVIGLDLGQAQDYSALCVLEWQAGPPLPEYAVRQLRRWQLGTSYTKICDDLGKFVSIPELARAVIVLDETGCGKPVADMVHERLSTLQYGGGLVGVTITAGHEINQVASGRWRVPKKTLVSVLQVLLQNRRLHVAEELPEAATLVKELQTFKVKITAAGNESFESWRERDHDDLVLSVALACWAAETLKFFRAAAPAPTTRRIPPRD